MKNVRIHFGYWSDPLCIWAFVAQSMLDRILTAHGDKLDVEYRVIPVFGSVPWRFTRGPWAKGGVDERVAATQRIAAEHGHPEVSGEVWRSNMPASSWAPALAIKAVFASEAAQELPRGSGALFQVRLRERFFVHNVNVALRTEQLAVAESLNLGRARIERRLDDGSALATLWEDHLAKEELRLQGSPTYVFEGGRAMLYGNFSYGILHATLEELVRGADAGASAC